MSAKQYTNNFSMPEKCLFFSCKQTLFWNKTNNFSVFQKNCNQIKFPESIWLVSKSATYLQIPCRLFLKKWLTLHKNCTVLNIWQILTNLACTFVCNLAEFFIRSCKYFVFLKQKSKYFVTTFIKYVASLTIC